jgi:ATP-binding cassette, subfamily C (CFTR/MRP), member 1
LILFAFGRNLGCMCSSFVALITNGFTAILTIGAIRPVGFTSFCHILVLSRPIAPEGTHLLAALACLDRIQDFLERDPRVDFRVPNLKRSETGPKKDNSDREDRGDRSGSAINIYNGNFGWETNKLCLKNINLDIPASSFTVVVGPIASGK